MGPASLLSTWEILQDNPDSGGKNSKMLRCWSHWHMRFLKGFHFRKEKCGTVAGRLTRTATSSQELIRTTHKLLIYKFTIIYMQHQQQIAPLLRYIHRTGGAEWSCNWTANVRRYVCACVLSCHTLGWRRLFTEEREVDCMLEETQPAFSPPGRGPGSSRTRTMLSERPVFTQHCCSVHAWVEALEMPLFITQPRSHYQQRLSMKVIRIIDAEFLEKCDVPSSMVRAVMDSLSAPWNSLKYGRTLIS